MGPNSDAEWLVHWRDKAVEQSAQLRKLEAETATLRAQLEAERAETAKVKQEFANYRAEVRRINQGGV